MHGLTRLICVIYLALSISSYLASQDPAHDLASKAQLASCKLS